MWITDALAETALYSLLVFLEARGMSLPSVPLLRTAFSVRIDLAKPTLSRDAALWTDPTRYDPSQELADRAPRQPDSSQTWAPVRRRDRRAGLP